MILHLLHLAWHILAGLAVFYLVFRKLWFHSFAKNGCEQEVHGYVPKRILSQSEHALAILNQNAHSIRTTTVHLLSGNLTQPYIREGLRVLQARYPALRMGTHYSGPNELRFHEYNDAERRVQLEVIGRRDGEHWKEELQHQMLLGAPAPVTHDQLLWRAVLLYDADQKQHELIVNASHCCLDGTASVILGPLLAHYCAKLERGTKGDKSESALRLAADSLCKQEFVAELLPSIDSLSQQHPLYRSSLTWPQALLPTIPRAILNFMVHPSHARPVTFVPLGERRDHVDCCILEAKALANLREKCREHSVTVHAALMGVAAKAYQESFHIPEGKEIEFTTAVRLGNFFNIDRKELGVFISHVVEPCRLRSRDATLWPYAVDGHNELHVNPATSLPGSAFRELAEWPGLRVAIETPLIVRFLLRFMSKFDGGRLSNVLLSNLGDLTSHLPEDIESWHHSFLGQDGRVLGAEFFVFLYSFRNQMYISTTWTEPLVSRAQGERFVSNFLHFLRHPDATSGDESTDRR